MRVHSVTASVEAKKYYAATISQRPCVLEIFFLRRDGALSRRQFDVSGADWFWKEVCTVFNLNDDSINEIDMLHSAYTGSCDRPGGLGADRDGQILAIGFGKKKFRDMLTILINAI